jgi:hypothetical protein
MGLLYGRAGRLTAENGGFRRGQESDTRTPDADGGFHPDDSSGSDVEDADEHGMGEPDAAEVAARRADAALGYRDAQAAHQIQQRAAGGPRRGVGPAAGRVEARLAKAEKAWSAPGQARQARAAGLMSRFKRAQVPRAARRTQPAAYSVPHSIPILRGTK